MRYLIALACFLLCAPLIAAEPPPGLELAHASIDPMDIAAIKRGGKLFAEKCMVCHTMTYLRYNALAQSVGVTYDRMPVHVTTWPNGIKPPDLSSEVSIRGVDWVVTYLHSFYQDSTRPTGANNLLVPGTGMSAILWDWQGEQRLVQHPLYDRRGHAQWYDLLQPIKEGSMTPEQFDANVKDIVSFLAYASEPYYMQQHRIGRWVLVFLAFMFVLAWLLKRDYWQELKKYKGDHTQNKR